jgi:hypothetical protein
MSFSTRTMRGTTETPQIRIENQYDVLHKTATPQLLPTMLRLNNSKNSNSTSSTYARAPVQIVVAHSTQPAAGLLPSGSLFPSNVLNLTTSRVSEPEADWRTHALLSDVPDLSARLSNLDKEIRVGSATSADSTTQVLRMHNAVLESHDAGLEQAKTSTQATMQRCDELHTQHAKHTNNTRAYLTKTQEILESHEDRLADLLVAHQAHADSATETMDLLDATHDVLNSHDTSIESLHELHEAHADELSRMSTKAEASQEYLTMAQGILESHDDSIHALREATRTNAQLLKQLSHKTSAGADPHQFAALADGHDNTMEYLKLNQGMMETFHRSIDGLQETNKAHARLFADMSGNQDASRDSRLLAQQVAEHKTQLSALQSANSELRDSLHQVHDELDALHGR